MIKLNNIFQKEHATLIKELSQEQIEIFKNAADDLSRIRIMYPYLSKYPINLVGHGKDYEKALIKKNEGNSYFANKKSEQAIACYNTGIILCPYNNSESQYLLPLLIANRSACLFELDRYKDAISDIDYALSMRNCPEKIKYKLHLRKANCYRNMTGYAYLATDIYKLALSSLIVSELKEAAIEQKRMQIASAMEDLKEVKKSIPSTKEKNEPFKHNDKYINASSAVTFNYTKELGRFAEASENIDSGQIIIDETAHCAVLATEFSLKNCQYCSLATDKPVPCDLCSHIIFCSVKCKQSATTYHQYECGFQATMFASGASINCFMAIRIITQHPFAYFEKLMHRIQDNSLNSEIHNSDDYSCVYNLCRNENLRKSEDYFPYTVMALYLLRLLKTSNYFNATENKNASVENEMYIGSLILRNLQILQFNAHEISELRIAPPGPLDSLNELNCKATYVGGGLYPTLALFNHSCDPSIVRYNIGTRMIVKTIKPIKKGETIYENYGPIYSDCPRVQRRSVLNERYWFECVCSACTNNWPLFNDMSDNIVKISCSNKNCTDYFYLSDALDSATIACGTCKTNINILPILKALTELEIILPKAEELYMKQLYENAAKIYFKAINIYYKYTVPPFPDLIKVQQRLRTCIVHQGNKSINCLKNMKDSV